MLGVGDSIHVFEHDVSHLASKSCDVKRMSVTVYLLLCPFSLSNFFSKVCWVLVIASMCLSMVSAIWPAGVVMSRE